MKCFLNFQEKRTNRNEYMVTIVQKIGEQKYYINVGYADKNEEVDICHGFIRHLIEKKRI